MSTVDLVPLERCAQCGAELDPDVRFCSNCGQAVRGAELAPAKPEPTYGSDSQPSYAPVPSFSAVLETGGGIGKLFSATGRIGRLEYFLTVIGVWVVLIVAWLIIVAIDVPAITILIGIGTWLLAIVISVCAGVKRLHDFDQSGWLYLLFLVPFASFILLFVLLLKGSSIGLNRFGYEDSGSVMG